MYYLNMKIKIVKKIEIWGYDGIKRKVSVSMSEVKKFNFESVKEVCGCNDEDGMGWKVWGEDKDVMVIGCEDGDVEFVVIKS